MRFLYRHANAMLMPSKGAADDFARYIGFPRNAIRITPSPVVTPALEAQAGEPPQHPWLHDKKTPVILGIGELSSRKDFSTLLRAFALLHNKRPCRLIIYGRGKQKDALASLASELGVSDDFDLPGFTANPYSEIHAADLLVLTSRWEGLGIVLVEALALGTPAIATDCPSGPREVLDNQRYGPLVPIGDYEQLARAIEKTLDNPPPAEFLRQGAAPYTMENSINAYLAALGLDGS
jgi:glycosyltransferase involved in cell wall biosynthesis